MSKRYITAAGYEQLKFKTEELMKRSVDIKEEISVLVAEDKEAENTLYQESLAQQANIDRQIIEIKEKLNTIEIINTNDYKPETKSHVRFGAIVKVKDVDTEKEMTFQIVGPDEIDLSGDIKKISYESPVGKALLNKKKNDPVDILKTNGDDVEYEILSINY